MYSTEFLNDENYASKAQRNNRLLIESENLDNDDDGFTRRNGGGGGQLLAPPSQLQRRNPAPLIEEEEPEPAPRSKATDRDKANLARYLYKKNQDSRSPWQKFDDAMATKAQSTKNVQTMFGGESGDTLGFGKLFGQKSNWQSAAKAKRAEQSVQDTSSEVDGESKPAKGLWGSMKRFWWRFKNRGLSNAQASSSVGFRQAAIGPKMPWMQRLFGARRKPGAYAASAKGMGIMKPKAQGWADQLVDASESGRLDRDAGGSIKSGGVGEKPAVAPEQQLAQQEPAHKSYEDYIEEEEKVPAAPSKQPLLTAKQAKHNSFMGTMYAMQQMNAMEKSGGNGNPHDTIDDNSIDQSENGDEGYDKGGLYNQDMLNAYMYDDEQDDDGGGKPGYLQDHIMSIFNKK